MEDQLVSDRVRILGALWLQDDCFNHDKYTVLSSKDIY